MIKRIEILEAPPMRAILRIRLLSHVLAFILVFSLTPVFAQRKKPNQSVKRTITECDFSYYHPLIISHALLNAAVRRVEPLPNYRKER